jgi:uroporphyrinogen decarboxylase
MGYMIEGGGSKTMSKAKHWLETWPKESLELLTLLKDVIVDYLVMQVESGAQMLQVFESSAEHLPKETFLKLALPLMKDIRNEVNEKLTAKNIATVPMVIFAKGAMHSLPEIAATGYEVVGLDWTIDPLEARKLTGPNVTLQGIINC